jgi:hypothetical protein
MGKYKTPKLTKNPVGHLIATLAAHRLFSFAKNDFELWQALKSNGVNLDLVTDLAGPIIRTVVTFLPDGLYENDSFGEIALAMAVHDENAETVIDLVAWSTRDIATFGTLFGAGVLGLDMLFNPASYSNGPCCLYSNPLAWLRANCAGAVVLDHAKAKTLLQAAPGPLTTDTLYLAECLTQTGIIPANRLLVPSTWRNAA